MIVVLTLAIVGIVFGAVWKLWDTKNLKKTPKRKGEPNG